MTVPIVSIDHFDLVVPNNYFQAHNCQFTGKWQFYGTKSEANPSNEDIICQHCVIDYQRRLQNYQDMNVRIKLRSYQIVGLTKPYDQFEWEKTVCKNPTGCWGPSERIFEVRQKNDKMQLVHYKIRPNQTNEEVVNRLYLSLKKKESQSQHIFTTIGSCTNMKSFFWPDLFGGSSSQQKNTVYFYAAVIPRDPVTGFENVPLVWRPNSLKSPSRVYPMIMNFEFFESYKQLKLPFPESYQDLVRNYKPSHLTYLDMYEGGGGLRASQYKWIDNNSMDRKDPLPLWTNKWSSTDLDVALYENRFRARWINPYHLDEDTCYVRNYQNGFAGPITSFWARVHKLNKWYS